MQFPRENLLNKNTTHTNIRASLSIMGEYFDMQKIADALEVNLGYTWNKGEFIRDDFYMRMMLSLMQMILLISL